MCFHSILPDYFCFNSILNSCFKIQNSLIAKELFDKMKNENLKFKMNLIQCTKFMKLFENDFQSIIDLLNVIEKQNINLDRGGTLSLIKICMNMKSLDLCKKVHFHILKNNNNIKNDIAVQTSLISMYSKCGSLEDSIKIFNQIDNKDKNIITWNSMINAFGEHGYGIKSIELFDEMQKEGIIPDEITFISLLNSCSHSGLVNEAEYYFDLMKTKYNISPTIQHYNCMVDVLSRSNQLDKAEEFILSIEKPNIITWKTLLGACRIHKDINRAKRIADKIIELDKQDASAYVLLSNIYASLGQFDEVKRVRSMMKENGVKKIPGMTWIEIDGKTHSFVVNDKSHENTSEIYEKLKWLNSEMKKSGYIPDTSFILHDIEEEMKEELICYHSERLAISFGLLKLPSNSKIIITKNLRVCGDCHNATKYISQICSREIIVRDSNRFHHFKNGKCSCNDYY